MALLVIIQCFSHNVLFRCLFLCSYPDLQLQTVLGAHPANCICIEFDPTGKYFATGSVDALVSLWDVEELACVRTFSRYGGGQLPDVTLSPNLLCMLSALDLHLVLLAT